jgi:outer membrane protein OmpA-like peptidoglycan-associated protein
MSGVGNQVQQTACADFAFPVYFQSESDQLTPEATQLIAQSATRAKSCSVVGVSITGLEATNADLAARRVAAVDKALLANGIAAQAAVIQAPPAHGLTLLHRRIEVDVRLAPPKS